MVNMEELWTRRIGGRGGRMDTEGSRVWTRMDTEGPDREVRDER